MPFAPGSDSVPNGGKADPSVVATTMMRQCTWMRRLSLEILAEDPTLNVVKIYQLAQMCMNFRTQADQYRDVGTGDLSDIVTAINDLQRTTGIGNPNVTDAQCNSDLKTVYQAAGVFASFAQANLPQNNNPVSNTTVISMAILPNFDLKITMPLMNGVKNQVTALRAAFV